ncbi:MAG: hypothetical protein ACE141_00015 [Bryobacteraceae bacterium]
MGLVNGFRSAQKALSVVLDSLVNRAQAGRVMAEGQAQPRRSKLVVAAWDQPRPT